MNADWYGEVNLGRNFFSRLAMTFEMVVNDIAKTNQRRKINDFFHIYPVEPMTFRITNKINGILSSMDDDGKMKEFGVDILGAYYPLFSLFMFLENFISDEELLQRIFELMFLKEVLSGKMLDRVGQWKQIF